MQYLNESTGPVKLTTIMSHSSKSVPNDCKGPGAWEPLEHFDLPGRTSIRPVHRRISLQCTLHNLPTEPVSPPSIRHALAHMQAFNDLLLEGLVDGVGIEGERSGSVVDDVGGDRAGRDEENPYPQRTGLHPENFG